MPSSDKLIQILKTLNQSELSIYIWLELYLTQTYIFMRWQLLYLIVQSEDSLLFIKLVCVTLQRKCDDCNQQPWRVYWAVSEILSFLSIKHKDQHGIQCVLMVLSLHIVSPVVIF